MLVTKGEMFCCEGSASLQSANRTNPLPWQACAGVRLRADACVLRSIIAARRKGGVKKRESSLPRRSWQFRRCRHVRRGPRKIVRRHVWKVAAHEDFFWRAVSTNKG